MDDIKVRKFLYVDWMSTRGHNAFNEAFFFALGIKDQNVIFFDKCCTLKNQKCEYVKLFSKNRVFHALVVYWKVLFSKGPIFFLTYDHFFIIPLLFFRKDFYCFEHNTTPSKDEKLKSWVQKIFLKKLRRCSQSIHGKKRLMELNQNSSYLGIPLFEPIPRTPKVKSVKPCILVPSNRLNKDWLKKIVAFSVPIDIFIRKSAVKNMNLDNIDISPNVKFVDWFNLQDEHSNFIAIYDVTRDNIRGSGWFNEAISRGVSICFATDQTRDLFKSAFPNYPHDMVRSESELKSVIEDRELISSEKVIEYITDMNLQFRTNFYKMSI